MSGAYRRSVLAGLMSVVLIAPTAAQDSPGSGDPMGYGAAQAGLIWLDLDELNASLTAAGLPALDASVPAWGGSGYGIVGKFHFGAVGHGGLDPAAVVGSRRASLGGGYGIARVRYEALALGGLRVYPAVGVGGGAMTLEIAELDTPSFDDVLADPSRSSSLSTGGFIVLNAGLGIDYRFQVQQRSDGGGWGFVLGVEGGYLYSPGDTSWELDGINEVMGGPDLGIRGFYVWFSIGGWGREGERPS